LGKIFWEFPLTAIVCLSLIASYVSISLFVPHSTQYHYFFSYPGKYNPVNWFLSSLYHASPAHLFSNIIFLFFLGRAVEARSGPGKWILYYTIAGIVSGFGDSFARSIMSQHSSVPTVGASGAICGIAAVAGLVSPYSIIISGKKIIFPVFLISWTMIYSDFTNLFTNDNVAHWSHLGGYLSVFLTSYIMDENERDQLKKSFYLNVLFFILSIFLLFLIQSR
jgi:membrane associated rhomboid family serine protease